MKLFFTIIAAIATTITQAQNVNIPDTIFKAILVDSFDTNHDGEIQQTEALAVTEMHIPAVMVRLFNDTNGPMVAIGPHYYTGIEAFTNLRRLKIDEYGNYIGAGYNEVDGNGIADLSGMLNLQYVHCSNISMASLNLNDCTGLDSLILDDSLGRHFPTRVHDYNADPTAHRVSLNIGNCVGLKYLQIGGILRLYNYNLLWQGIPHLKTLILNGVYFYNLSLREMPELEEIYYQGIPSLFNMNSSNDPVVDLNLQGFTQLKKLEMLSIVPQNMNFDGCINLQSFKLSRISGNYDRIDLSGCYSLKTLNLYAIRLNRLNIKNGSSVDYPNCHFTDSSVYLKNICADDFEVDSLRYYFSIADRESYYGTPNPSVNISSYCSFYPGGPYNTISGNTKFNSGAGCNGASRLLSEVGVKLIDSTGQAEMVYSSAAGNYSISTDKGNFRLFPYFAYPYYSVSPATATVHFDTANYLTSTNDFCISPVGVHNDLEITFLPAGGQRPGFSAVYALVYKNRGTTVLSGNIQVNFDNSRMNFASASENIAAESTGQLTWNYNNLLPLESKTIHVIFNLLPSPVNNIGDTVIYLATITPSVNDETPFDNSFILPQRLTASYDPNDKQCLQGSKLDISKIGDYLHYQIRFQNEGTDTAFNIVIADTLSDKLDWNTFEFISSSHNCSPRLKNNKVEFIFENIQLPYKTINEPASNGWVAFKIKPKPSVVIGDSLNNTAAIYFDFNLPVITNTATTIVSNASTPVPVKLEYFSVNQKNNTNVVNWKASCSYGNASFIIERSSDGIHFKGAGNVAATAVRCQLPFSFTDNNPGAGKNYYRIKITDADGKSFYSKIAVVGNNKAGIEITAVANDMIYLNSNKQQTIQLKVIAADGKEMLNRKQILSTGYNNISLQMKNTGKGIYTIVMYTTEGETVTKKFIK